MSITQSEYHEFWLANRNEEGRQEDPAETSAAYAEELAREFARRVRMLAHVPDAGDVEDLDGDKDSPNVITSDWVLATVVYPDGRHVTAMWAMDILDEQVLTNPGTAARIHS